MIILRLIPIVCQIWSCQLWLIEMKNMVIQILLSVWYFQKIKKCMPKISLYWWIFDPPSNDTFNTPYLQIICILVNKLCSMTKVITICAQLLRLWFLRSFNVIWERDTFFEIRNHLTIPTLFSTYPKTISRRNELWVVGVSIVARCDLLGPYRSFWYFCEMMGISLPHHLSPTVLSRCPRAGGGLVREILLGFLMRERCKWGDSNR